MYAITIRTLLVTMLSSAFFALLPGLADAQYRCAVAIELKGKAILQGQIRDVERPPTDQLWDLLKTLSFSPTAGAKDLPDLKSGEKATLNGDLRVKIDGAGTVTLKDLRLVPNGAKSTAWVIAPADVTRILQMRKAESKDLPK